MMMSALPFLQGILGCQEMAHRMLECQGQLAEIVKSVGYSDVWDVATVVQAMAAEHLGMEELKTQSIDANEAAAEALNEVEQLKRHVACLEDKLKAAGRSCWCQGRIG